MTTLIIYAHPHSRKGHCATILEEVEASLKARKQSYELIDLYKIKYDPVLHEGEHYTGGGKNITPQNKKFQEKIQKAIHLIVIFPVWWNSTPAILKGFFDHIITVGFAYRFKPFYGKTGIPIQLLKGRRAVIFNTSGAHRFLHWLIEGDRSGKVVARDTLGFSGIKSKYYTIGSAVVLDDSQIQKIKKVVPKGLKWLYQ